jgi:hypothetical protein
MREKNPVIEIIREVQNHPFDFGFRTAFLSGKAFIYTPDKGQTWRVNITAPKVNERWSGNCIQDVLLTTKLLRSKLPETATTSIHYLDGKSLHNSSWNQDHFKVFVEDPSCGVAEYVDHSPFHQTWLGPGNTGIHEWVEISCDAAEEIQSNHEPMIDGQLVVMSYTEFEVRGTPGNSFVSLFHKGASEDNFLIALDLVMPGLPVGDTDWRVTLDIPYGQIDRSNLYDIVTRDEVVYIRNHPAYSKYTPEKTSQAKVDFPQELKTQLHKWFREVISLLPEKIPDPNIS